MKNNTNEEINNINLIDKIPDELIYVTEVSGNGYKSEYKENSNIKEFTYTIEKLKAQEEINVKYFARVKQNENVGNKIGTKATATISESSEQVYESNLVQNTIKESKLQIDILTPNENIEYYRPNDGITYFIKVKNISEENLENINITYKMPDNALYSQSLELTKDEQNNYYYELNEKMKGTYSEENKEVTWNLSELQSNEEKAFQLTIKLKDVTTDKNIIKIENLVKASVNEEEYYSNLFVIDQLNKAQASVVMRIDPEKNVFYEDEEFEYIITIMPKENIELGSAELRDLLPEGLTAESITYYKEEGEESTTTTDRNITISFDLLEEETMTIKILVKVDKLNEDEITKELRNQATILGNNIITELSNEVTILVQKKESSGTNNPPSGENNKPKPGEGGNSGQPGENNPGGNTENPNENDNNGNGNNNQTQNKNRFDLKLEKYINKITVKDDKQTYQYSYDEAKLAKIELDRKTLNNTSVVIEYKILVKNEGNVAGYVKKIIDNMPKDLTFNSELNKTWYSNNGMLQNISLENVLIQPGETKEISLILTKNISKNDIKTFENSAGIEESISRNGTSDVNKINDNSEATLIVSIKTGKTVEYIIFLVVLISIMAIGMYEINKRVLKE